MVNMKGGLISLWLYNENNKLRSLILGFWTSSIVQKPSINECYTPSSEPYRVNKLRD
jgi:hypothetical protein